MEENKADLTSHEKKELKRLDREQEKEKTGSIKSQSRRKSVALKIAIWSIAIIIILGGVYLYGNSKARQPGKYDSFAKCLAENNVVMYGTDWCPHCQAQKKLFGKSFEFVVYINCDTSPLCDANNVNGYPTWIFKDNSRLEGTQELDVLAEKSSCALE